MARTTKERYTTTYTVREGDTLSSIARQQTGSASYGAIWQQNEALIGDNPNNVTAGMVLLIPGDAAQGVDAW